MIQKIKKLNIKAEKIQQINIKHQFLERKSDILAAFISILACVVILTAYVIPSLRTKHRVSSILVQKQQLLMKSEEKVKDLESKKREDVVDKFDIEKDQYEIATKLQNMMSKLADKDGLSVDRFTVSSLKEWGGLKLAIISTSITGDIKGLVDILSELENITNVRVKRLIVSRRRVGREERLRMNMIIECVIMGG